MKKLIALITMLLSTSVFSDTTINFADKAQGKVCTSEDGHTLSYKIVNVPQPDGYEDVKGYQFTGSLNTTFPFVTRLPMVVDDHGHLYEASESSTKILLKWELKNLRTRKSIESIRISLYKKKNEIKYIKNVFHEDRISDKAVVIFSCPTE